MDKKDFFLVPMKNLENCRKLLRPVSGFQFPDDPSLTDDTVCDFGQSLLPTNYQVNFSFFWSAKRKLYRLRDQAILLSHSLEFFRKLVEILKKNQNVTSERFRP